MADETLPLRILFVEDNPDDVELVLLELRRRGLDIEHHRVETAETLREALEHGEWDLVLSDFSMPRFSAPAALRVLQESSVDVPFIIVSGTIGEEAAVESLKAGAEDFLVKGHLHRLVPAIERGLREAEVRRSRRQAEESLRENERMLQHAQRMDGIGQLAGGVAHDFNNLLTVIRGRAEMLLDEVPESGVADLHEIIHAAERGSALTRQLLTFGRRHSSEYRVVALNDLVDECLHMIKRLLSENITVRWTPVGAPTWVRVDQTQIEQILVNLAVNAGDAMPKGGTLEIETARTPEGATLLRVADDGCGMSQEVQARAFEPFYTTKEEGRGTGLGLSIVYGIVEQNGGTIQMESAPGRGTEYRITLPAATPGEPAEASVEPPQAIERNGQRTVLVVEDDPSIRALTCRILADHGYTVLHAEKPADALRLVTDHEGPLNVLLTDVNLSGISGSELARRVQDARPRVKVLFMSGYHDDSGVTRRVSAREAGFLPKPFTPDQLLTAVDTTLAEGAAETFA